MTRRWFLLQMMWVFALVIIGTVGVGVPAGCDRLTREKKKKPQATSVEIVSGDNLLTALTKASPVTTRSTQYGTEVVSIAGRTAVKGTGADDGFVILVDGAVPSFAVDQFPLFAGTHTIEVRYVPFGVHGKDGETILTVTATAK